MGFPATGTIDVPGNTPLLAAAVRAALTDPTGIRSDLLSALGDGTARAGHLCVNTWVFNPDLTRILLVDHPRFSWTQPGGHLNPAETPADGAARELLEETGLHATVHPTPLAVVATLLPATATAAAHVHYTLSYAATADPGAALTVESGQPAAWFNLNRTIPEGFFGDNHHAHQFADLIRAHLHDH